MTKKPETIAEIEDAMATVMLRPEYPKLVAEFNRLLSIMGNVDDNEIISLVIVASVFSKGKGKP